jgi:vacuolar-type H+-ATPase subunit D/Vma8
MTKTGIEIYEQNKILKKKNDDLKKEFITKYKELKKIRENVQNTIDLNNFLQEKIDELENI